MLNEGAPKARNWRLVILIATPFAAALSALVVAYILNPCFLPALCKEVKDPNIGKYAYSTHNGQYIGKIEANKASDDVWGIREPNRGLVGIPKAFVEISDIPPGPPDEYGRSFKNPSGKPANH